jgi:hypothetical protein
MINRRLSLLMVKWFIIQCANVANTEMWMGYVLRLEIYLAMS